MPNPTHTPWSTEELDRLRQAYEVWPPRYDLLPGRSRSSLHQKAHKLGLSNRRVVDRALSHLAPTDWAYLAAFIDGEGSISLGHARSVAKLIATNTNDDVIQWLHDKFPGGSWSTYTRKPGDDERKGFQGTTKPCHHISWVRHDLVYEMLTGMLPYLIIKKDRALKAIADLRENFPALERFDEEAA